MYLKLIVFQLIVVRLPHLFIFYSVQHHCRQTSHSIVRFQGFYLISYEHGSPTYPSTPSPLNSIGLTCLASTMNIQSHKCPFDWISLAENNSFLLLNVSMDGESTPLSSCDGWNHISSVNKLLSVLKSCPGDRQVCGGVDGCSWMKMLMRLKLIDCGEM